MKNLLTLIFIMTFSIVSNGQFDQNIEKIIINMNDGKTIEAIFIKMDQKKIVYSLEGKSYTVDKSEVKNYSINNSTIDVEEDLAERKKYQESYFLFPSALPAGKGTFYYRNYNIILNQFTLGLSDYFTMSGGFESASIFSGSGTPIFYLSPKFSFGKDNIHFGVGTSLFVYENNYGGLVFTNMTLGSKSSNFTIGISKAYFEDELSEDIIFNFNCALPISNKVSFIAESILYNSAVNGLDFTAIDAGIRYTTQSGIAIDASIIKPDGYSGVLPLLGLTLPIGSK